MHPILFSFGIFKIYSYGLFVAIAFITSISYLSYSIKKSKEKIISHDDLYSLFTYIMITGIIGARLLFIFTDNLNNYILSPLEIFKVWQGGLVYYGGFISATAFTVIYIKRKKMSLFKLGDLFAPALALGHGIGRIGCFFAGCCYGKASNNIPWSVIFTDDLSLAVKGIHLHPTQLYEALSNFLLFLFLHFYYKKEHKAGIPFAVYLTGCAVLRFTIEFLRGDYRGIQYYGLSISQIISVFLFITGVFIICRKK
ncbi:MAG: prolipoprotein diacylglyceryl transferase [Endomicrobium sp.]|jgi:phosphatidylglycerol:prolipoprotein diacylglycerol transferase|nr:prolipoprotein diacylglyceryl transferase [Endomicrobium sp.]